MNLKSIPLGLKKDVAVLFCDMFNYTAICEEYSLEYVADFLNTYYCAMAGSILESHGIVGSFVGDAIIGYFGMVENGNACKDAVATAQVILERSDEFVLPNGQPILNGIGIDVGDVMLANVGSIDDAQDRIVIGKPINAASRLEKLTRYSCHRMLITDAVYDRSGESQRDAFVNIGRRYIRGIDDSMVLYGEKLEY